jgi:hypothetical protein
MALNLKSFHKALFPQSRSQWASETNAIFAIGVELLGELNSSEMTPEQEQEFYATAIGTIIAGIAYNTDKYANSDYTFISTDVDNKYYKVPHYPLGWAKLYEACGIDEVLKTWDKPYQQGFMTKEHPVFLNMIKVSGAKILSGDLRPQSSFRQRVIFTKPF